MPDRLDEMPFERANQLVMHPIHRDAFPTLVQLIVDLRQCRTYADYRQFQGGLLARVLEVQAHRSACTRVAKRLRGGKTVPANAPELRSGADANDPESWELEAAVCERVDRQFRSIGDALAWHMFNYDRRIILALSRNQSSGPMAGKEGLLAEQEFMAQYSQDDNFVLLHDLTNCLRIGDTTLFVGTVNYEAFLYEIKTNPDKRKPAQLRRKKLAEEAIRDGGPLPDDPTARLVNLDIPYKTHLGMLFDAFKLAQSRGVQEMKIPGGRALVAVDMRRGSELWSTEEFSARIDVANCRAVKRAGLAENGQSIIYASDDLVARSPVVPPWAVYPLPPVVCTNLIVDAAVYFVTMSSESLLDALDMGGIRADWTLPPETKQIDSGQVILNAHGGGRTVQMRQAELERVLMELVDLETWVEGIKQLLERDNLSGHPWPHYGDEWKVWV